MENKELSAQYFLSNLSHEIRTPLNGIVGYTQLLFQTKLDKTQQMYINSMNHCCVQLVELVNDILDFSKLTTGKAQVNNECFSIKEVIDEVNSAVNFKIKEKHQKFRYILEKDLPEYIISDKHKIIQILINLLSNANKYTQMEGNIFVSISLKKDNLIHFSVEDNGIGISLENQKKLFNPFFQVQESLTKNGVGLGLAICKKLVELLGGQIDVQSEKDYGTTFTFTVKYEPYEQYQEYIEKNGDILKEKYILIVDESVDNRLTMGETLFEYNMRPIICSSGKEALRLVSGKRYPFSLGLIAISMTTISGTELSKQIKDITPGLPIIAFSSIDENFNHDYFEDVLKNPINKVKLIQTISKILNKNNISQYQLNPVEEKVVTPKREIRILIAEDVSYNWEMLTKMLNNMGYKQIDIAKDGLETIEKVDNAFDQGKPYDILLLDLKMPRMDGLGVAEHIKNNHYLYPKIAVVTASVLETDRERCKELGIKYFLLKPIISSHLKNILNKILHGSGNFTH